MTDKEPQNKKAYVPWSILGILLVVLTGVLSVMWSEIKEGSAMDMELKADIREVKTDVKWLKDAIKGGEISIIKTWKN